MIKSSKISQKLHDTVSNIINLAMVSHQAATEFKDSDLEQTENFLSYLRNETEANYITASIDEDLTELGLFFDSIQPLKERYDIIKALYLSQFKASKSISEEEISQFLAGTGIGETEDNEYPEEEDGLVDVDAPFPSVNTFTNLPESVYTTGKTNG